MKNFTLFLLLFAAITMLPAQSPRSLTSDVTGTLNASSFYTVTQIESTFNSARRQEETQLGLGTNAIKDLDLPDQATWNGYSYDQKMLYIVNDERTARAGVNYGDGPVPGVPYQGVESTVDGVSQAYAELLVTNNTFSHGADGSNPYARIANAVGTSCREFNAYSENLAVAASSGPNPFSATIEASIFAWNYQDASSAWGHRIASLAQNMTDNNGDAGQEGFIGVGVAAASSFTLFGSCCPYASMVVLNFYDPVSTAAAANCPYNVTVTTNSLSGNSCENAVVATATNGNADISAINTITTSGTVIVTGTVAYKAGTSIKLNSGFHAVTGSNFTASIEACVNTLTGDELPIEVASARSFTTRFTTIPQEHKGLETSIISPNPFDQSFMVNYTLSTPSTVNIDVFNLRGQKMMDSRVLADQDKGTNQVAIDGEHWTAGIYFVRIQMGDQLVTKRLIKQ